MPGIITEEIFISFSSVGSSLRRCATRRTQGMRPQGEGQPQG